MHTLVAEAFLNYKRDGKTITGVVNHIDKNKLNNNIENLEVTTQRKNMIHSMTKRRLMDCPLILSINLMEHIQSHIIWGVFQSLKRGKDALSIEELINY